MSAQIERGNHKDYRTETYKTLRHEQIEGIKIDNNKLNNAIIAVLSVWGPAFAICVACLDYINNKENISVYLVAVFVTAQIVLFYGAVFLILSIASRNAENMQQIIAIGSYIKVFYEMIPMIRKEMPEHWEEWNTKLNPVFSDNVPISVEESAEYLQDKENCKRMKKLIKFNFYDEVLVLAII